MEELPNLEGPICTQTAAILRRFAETENISRVFFSSATDSPEMIGLSFFADFDQGENSILIQSDPRDIHIKGRYIIQLYDTSAHLTLVDAVVQLETDAQPASVISNIPEHELNRVHNDSHPAVGSPLDDASLALLYCSLADAYVIGHLEKQRTEAEMISPTNYPETRTF